MKLSGVFSLQPGLSTAASLTKSFTETQTAEKSQLRGQKPVTWPDGVVRLMVRLKAGHRCPCLLHGLLHPAKRLQKQNEVRVRVKRWEPRGQDSQQTGITGG